MKTTKSQTKAKAPEPVQQSSRKGAEPIQQQQQQQQPNAIYFNGPDHEQDKHGEDIPIWYVFFGDHMAQPLGKVYCVLNYGRAETLAKRMSRDRSLELVNDANQTA